MNQENILRDARLSFIGCGTMAEAMMAGVLKRELVKAHHICGSHPRASRREELTKRYAVEMCESNADAVRFGYGANDEAQERSIVVLCVKPQRLRGVLAELKGVVRANQTVLSIVAGNRVEKIGEGLGHSSIVRAMPNTPAQIGAGITAWYASEKVSDDESQMVRALLQALGREMQVETENMIEMATALSGTGPTYIFMMMEALTDAGVHLGFSRHVAQELVTETILGSVLFARETHKHPAELRNMVTSPGGTSAEAIYQMEKGGLRTLLSKAVYAAYQKAVKLGEK
ncbi:MAG: pyrroline-5-carboxylate reductase [Pyrinomonadaceae bacterium MAG19_C2-C3]|nr:pyrroline-5-carboxylate reductase [Pyrinomonadaceae bacterium MAG19_C2-C3]